MMLSLDEIEGLMARGGYAAGLAALRERDRERQKTLTKLADKLERAWCKLLSIRDGSEDLFDEGEQELKEVVRVLRESSEKGGGVK